VRKPLLPPTLKFSVCKNPRFIPAPTDTYSLCEWQHHLVGHGNRLGLGTQPLEISSSRQRRLGESHPVPAFDLPSDGKSLIERRRMQLPSLSNLPLWHQLSRCRAFASSLLRDNLLEYEGVQSLTHLPCANLCRLLQALRWSPTHVPPSGRAGVVGFGLIAPW
jgi:hypothetical protein